MAISKEYTVSSFDDLVTFAIAFFIENGFTVGEELEVYGPRQSGQTTTSFRRRIVTKGNNTFYFGYCSDYSVPVQSGYIGQVYINYNDNPLYFINGLFFGPVLPDFSAAGKQNCSMIPMFLLHGINFPAILRMHLLANDSVFVAVRCEQDVWKYLYSGYVDASISGHGLIPTMTGSGSMGASNGGVPTSNLSYQQKDKGFFGSNAYASSITEGSSYRSWNVFNLFMYFDNKWNTIKQENNTNVSYLPFGMDSSANTWIINWNSDFAALTFYQTLYTSPIAKFDNNSLTGFPTLFEFLIFRSSEKRDNSISNSPFYVYGKVPDIFLCPRGGLANNQELILGNDQYRLFNSIPKTDPKYPTYDYNFGPFFAIKAN